MYKLVLICLKNVRELIHSYLCMSEYSVDVWINNKIKTHIRYKSIHTLFHNISFPYLHFSRIMN